MTQSPETESNDNIITVVDNGPLLFKGTLDIENAPADNADLSNKAALCRCGLSNNKPFCDGTHRGSEFVDKATLAESGEAPEETGRSLKITFVDNGPIRLSGNMRIETGDGLSAWQGERTAICRCGLSQNKPFCDGAHRGSDWSSENS